MYTIVMSDLAEVTQYIHEKRESLPRYSELPLSTGKLYIVDNVFKPQEIDNLRGLFAHSSPDVLGEPLITDDVAVRAMKGLVRIVNVGGNKIVLKRTRSTQEEWLSAKRDSMLNNNFYYGVSRSYIQQLMILYGAQNEYRRLVSEGVINGLGPELLVEEVFGIFIDNDHNQWALSRYYPPVSGSEVPNERKSEYREARARVFSQLHQLIGYQAPRDVERNVIVTENVNGKYEGRLIDCELLIDNRRAI